MKEFEKVIGYENIKIELYRIIDMMINPKRYIELGVKNTKNLILYGEPGLGKTLLAECFIKASKRKAFTLRKNTADGDFAKSIKEIFEEAKKNAPSIVFLDDVDKFSDETNDNVDAEEFVIIQSCLDETKNDDVFVLATANNLCKMPRSLLRAGRFDKIIHVKQPDKNDIVKIVKHFLNDKKIDSTVDYHEIARFLQHKSCATLESIINEAGLLSAYDGKDYIDKDDIVKAFLRVEFDTSVDFSQENNEYTRRIATHEAGHALVNELLQEDSVLFVTINKNDSETGGFVGFENPEDYFYDKKFMENRVISLLAGKAATEIVYGVDDVGCISDLKRAFNIVTRFIKCYCTSGFEYFHESGFGYTHNCDNNTGERNRLIASEINNYYKQAKKLIINNRQLLDRLTDELVTNKVLTYKDIKRIKDDNSKKH